MSYLRKKINGLPVPKEYKVKSLSDYIKLFSDGNFDNCIFRGEPTNYGDIISSAFRNYSNTFVNPKKEYPFIKMKEEFKREIFHKINQDERINFLAFAQHHGIPTNLVDFTRTPLVALYFACQPYKSNDTHLLQEDFNENKGFVHILENKLIDITDVIAKNEDKNILKLIVSNEYDILVDIYGYFAKYETKHPLEFYEYFKQLHDDYVYYFINHGIDTQKKSNFPDYSEGDYKFKLFDIYEYIESDDIKLINSKIEKVYGGYTLGTLEYFILLRKFLNNIVDYTEPIWWLNCIPNFTYSPILSFERGRNQQGLFIYQAFLSFTEKVYDTPVLAQQRIWPDKTIIIENKEKILAELDFIGINQKFIYGDYDNIANYIKNKYK
ncbi:TPA: FRG domain-containing protein [Clostridioides difficile]|nr:FRG domain-containing protein [Clostridioides difficile]HBG0541854.1 FRG domain-containing protein [Clostridioides difficile]